MLLLLHINHLCKTSFLNNLHVAATDRFKTLSIKFQGISQSDQRSLLTLRVPDDLPPKDSLIKNWGSHRHGTVTECFLNRFENTSIDVLRRILDGERIVPSGMVLVETQIKQHRDEIEILIKLIKRLEAGKERSEYASERMS